MMHDAEVWKRICRERQAKRESNRLHIFQSLTGCRRIGVQYAHTRSEKEREGACVHVCVCVYPWCVPSPGCLLMSPLVGNSTDRPICDQGYISQEACPLLLGSRGGKQVSCRYRTSWLIVTELKKSYWID